MGAERVLTRRLGIVDADAGLENHWCSRSISVMAAIGTPQIDVASATRRSASFAGMGIECTSPPVDGYRSSLSSRPVTCIKPM